MPRVPLLLLVLLLLQQVPLLPVGGFDGGLRCHEEVTQCLVLLAIFLAVLLYVLAPCTLVLGVLIFHLLLSFAVVRGFVCRLGAAHLCTMDWALCSTQRALRSVGWGLDWHRCTRRSHRDRHGFRLWRGHMPCQGLRLCQGRRRRGRLHVRQSCCRCRPSCRLPVDVHEAREILPVCLMPVIVPHGLHLLQHLFLLLLLLHLHARRRRQMKSEPHAGFVRGRCSQRHLVAIRQYPRHVDAVVAATNENAVGGPVRNDPVSCVQIVGDDGVGPRDHSASELQGTVLSSSNGKLRGDWYALARICARRKVRQRPCRQAPPPLGSALSQ